jgi:hypothetical protein
MSEANPGASGGVKTLGVKLPDDLHARFVLIATLEKLSLAEAVVQAVEDYIERKRGEGDLAARAAQALGEIEREATLRRGALQALFGPQVAPTAEAAAAPEPGRPASRRGSREQTP